MCGIVGYLNLNGRSLTTYEDYLRPMCASITHRGPDDEGHFISGPVALGMTRLSIIDLKTGHQPICNEDQSVWIVFNGEIYNFHALQKLVINKGHTLKTGSDTEVIVHLYEEFGIACLDYLEGMFAFALWDTKQNLLFLARDRLGEKPLYWSVFEGQFIFGSELKAVLTHPKNRKQLNSQALQKYLALEYVPSPETIFTGIQKLLPAHYLVVAAGTITTKCYWQPSISCEKLTEKEAAEKLLDLLNCSVKHRLIADVPLGIFLSGGIDSSAIAYLASCAQNQAIQTFSIGFADSSFDESQYAQLVANHIHSDHHVEYFSPQVAQSTLEELVNFLDEPFADASIIPTYYLSKITRKQVKVALSGEGGDELFGGYPTYQAHHLANLWARIPKTVRCRVLEPAIRKLPVSFDNLSFDYKAKRFIQSASESPLIRHLHWMGAIPLFKQSCLLKPEFTSLTKDEELFPHLFVKNKQNASYDQGISEIMWWDINTYLPEDLLVKSDRASMAASLEVRLPFLAYPLVEFALSLPSSFKVKGMATKYLLKKALYGLLPSPIIKRPKKGFGIPTAKWLRCDLKPFVHELLAESYVKHQGLFQWEYIQQLLAEHNQGLYDHRKELWTLLMFQMWWRKFLG